MNIQRIRKLRSFVRLLQQNTYTTATEDKIQIPNRIPRGPTDILRALESTISRDPTAAHYKYQDDPYLIPMSNTGKRTFALAQEAGRKAAHWIRSEHSELFQHKECDPPIEAFFPKPVYNEKSEVSEEDLQKTVQKGLVGDAITVYKLLKERGIEVSSEAQQSLLELVCFYNSTDQLSDDFIEERWFRQSSLGKERQKKTWKDGDFAEALFSSIEAPTAESYCAIIQGMAKYNQAEKALHLLKESEGKGMILNTDTYNSLIMTTPFLREDYEKRWSFVVDMLNNIKRAKLIPNLGTLNATLYVLSTNSTGFSKQLALDTLAEFKSVGIEPSLASWNYVLATFCRERGQVSTILHDIMREIENKEHKVRDVKDTLFFVNAMEICRTHLSDKDLAKRLDNLLHFGSNYDLIGDSYKESVYYRHYMMLLCSTEPLDEFMQNVYFKLVPHIYVPEPSVMGTIIKNIEISGCIYFIPTIWSDMIIFDHTYREDLVTELLSVMVDNPADTSELTEKFAAVAWDVYKTIDNQNTERTNKISFTGDLLGNIMIVLLRAKEFEKASELMEKLDKNHTSIVGVPRLEALSMFVDACIENKAPSAAIKCIQYCGDCGFPEASNLAARLNEKLTLDESHLERLSRIIGDDSLPTVSKAENQ